MILLSGLCQWHWTLCIVYQRLEKIHIYGSGIHGILFFRHTKFMPQSDVCFVQAVRGLACGVLNGDCSPLWNSSATEDFPETGHATRFSFPAIGWVFSLPGIKSVILMTGITVGSLVNNHATWVNYGLVGQKWMIKMPVPSSIMSSLSDDAECSIILD